MPEENSAAAGAGTQLACSECGTKVIVVKPSAAALSCCGKALESTR